MKYALIALLVTACTASEPPGAPDGGATCLSSGAQGGCARSDAAEECPHATVPYGATFTCRDDTGLCVPLPNDTGNICHPMCDNGVCPAPASPHTLPTGGGEVCWCA